MGWWGEHVEAASFGRTSMGAISAKAQLKSETTS